MMAKVKKRVKSNNSKCGTSEYSCCWCIGSWQCVFPRPSLASESGGVLPRQELEELHKFLPPVVYTETSKPLATSNFTSRKAPVKNRTHSKFLPSANYVEPSKPLTPNKLLSSKARVKKTPPSTKQVFDTK